MPQGSIVMDASTGASTPTLRGSVPAVTFDSAGGTSQMYFCCGTKGKKYFTFFNFKRVVQIV